jgi:hypothetical protein
VQRFSLVLGVASTNRPSFLGNAACRWNAARGEGFKVLRGSEALVDIAIWSQKEKSPSREYLGAGCRFPFCVSQGYFSDSERKMSQDC